MANGTEDYRYCPRCGAEYRAEFTQCSDCGVALVDTPPQPAEEPDEGYYPSLDPHSLEYIYDENDWEQGLEPVLLTSVGSEIEADMLVGLLRSNNLRAYGQNETSHGISHYGGQAARSGPLALYRIYVHPKDEREARTFVDETQPSATGDFAADDTDDDVLAAPSSRRPWLVAVAAFLLFFAFFPGIELVRFVWDKLFG